MDGSLSRRTFVEGLIGGGALMGAGELLGAAGGGAPQKTYRACIIGSTGQGDYGHGLDLCFQRVPGVEVVALADPDERGRAETARRAGAARTYADWRQMLEKERPQLIANGPRWVRGRLEMMRAAAEIGANVYMEKPIAGSLEEADAMLAVADRAGIRIAVAHHVRFAPAVLHLKKLVDEGLLGDLLEMRTRGKEDNRSGGEDLMVLGTHCMYLMRLFGGDPLWCSARVVQDGREVTAADRRAATEPLGPVAGDSIHATYAFRGSLQGHFASQRARQPGGNRFSIALHGSKGVALVYIGADPEVFYLPDPLWSPGKSGARWQPLPGVPSNSDPESGLTSFAAQNRRIVLDLIRAIETKGESIASGKEARAALEMIMAVYASHLKGARVAFPLAERSHPLGALS